MNGKVLDVTLLVIWATVFLAVAMISPGLLNALVAWGGAVALGWYNTLVRHDPRDDSLRPRWRSAYLA
jgi:hypothetical protein